MKKLIIANWKAFGGKEILNSFKDFKAPGTSDTQLIICPPAPLIAIMGQDFLIGAQDCSIFDMGAHTGETTAAMLAGLGVKYCLVGHSERRHQCHESDAILSQKLAQLIKNNITPIFCVGEKAEERKQGHTNQVLSHQLMILSGLNCNNLIIAYEPVWAIGTGIIPTHEEIKDAHAFLRQETAGLSKDLHIVYGGSVTTENSKTILNIPGVDGVLVGKASTDPDKLMAMIKN